MPKTWSQKFEGGNPPHVVTLEAAFAGVPPGAKLLIASPKLLAQKIATIPEGQVRDVVELRRELAQEHGADATCPVSTAIFLRITAEAALEQLAKGTPVAQITPFWRAVTPGSKLAQKLSCGDDFLRHQRALEAASAAA